MCPNEQLNFGGVGTKLCISVSMRIFFVILMCLFYNRVSDTNMVVGLSRGYEIVESVSESMVEMEVIFERLI